MTRAALTVALMVMVVGGLLGAAGTAAQERPAAAPPLRLEDLERMALERNPTISQARASVRAAAGRQTQAGLYPSPMIGYEFGAIQTKPLDSPTAAQPSDGSSATRTFGPQEVSRDGRRGATTPPPLPPVVVGSGSTSAGGGGGATTTTLGRNSIWLQVPVVTAGKLGKSRDMATVDRRIAEMAEETQRLRVLTMVRVLFYEALGEARLIELREELARIAREAVDVSEELFNVGQADRPDLLEMEIEAERAELDVTRARSHQARIWQALGATVGDPALPLAPLAGDLEAELPTRDPQAVLARMLQESPEIRAARVKVERARAAHTRVRADRVPDFYVRARFGYLSDWLDLSRDAGFDAGIEITVPLPLFDRQQGNLAAAAADVEVAEREVERLELARRDDLAAALKDYADARAAADRYRNRILPRAEQAADLYRKSFEQMAAAYPQVLIAQRVLQRTRVEYIQALVALWRSATLLDGLLLRGGLDPADGTMGSGGYIPLHPAPLPR